MKKEKIKFNLNFSVVSWLVLISFIARLAVVFFLGDQYLENEWKTLLYNLENYKSYSFFTIDGQLIPSVYMPPLYPFFLYITKFISFEKISFISLVFFIQILLSTYGVFIFYKINQKIFSNNVSIINSFIFSLFPLNLYTTGQISSINFQIFLSLLFIQHVFYLSENLSKKNITIFSITSGLLFLIRGEFILIFLTSIFYLILLKKIKVKSLFKIIVIVSLIISPYVVRNYFTFDQITIVKSLGYNLWKGNNQWSLTEGSEFSNRINFSKIQKEIDHPEIISLKKKLKNIKVNKYYEINRDQVFLEEAKQNLISEPHRYFNLFLVKLFSYFFVDLQSNYPNYYNFFHFLPILVVSLLSLPGLIIAVKKNDFKMNYLLIYLFLNLIIFSIFFILPRYKLIILPIQIMLATLFINYIYRKFFKRF